ncbi:MAG: anti-sigma factor [Candidatus Sulfotelmatobacter sp.]
MTCVELQQSLAEIEDGSAVEQSAHLRTCPACSALVKELNLIIAAAGRLQAADEPSPRVWNSIEIALRQEGLIRPQSASRSYLPSFITRWGAARWLLPAAATVLLAVGIFMRGRLQPNDLVQQASLTTAQSDLNDEDLMQEVSDNAPAMKTQYQENLQRVNESIRDAQGLVDEAPNDEDARRSLMDAYHQKSMLFEMAMDHSLP